MNKNQNKETHPCAMVPCSALKTSQIRHQLHTWRLGHRTSQPWVGSAVVCGAVHGRCVLSLWAPSQPGVKYFYQKRTPAAKIPLSALRPSSYGILFSPPILKKCSKTVLLEFKRKNIIQVGILARRRWRKAVRSTETGGYEHKEMVGGRGSEPLSLTGQCWNGRNGQLSVVQMSPLLCLYRI